MRRLRFLFAESIHTGVSVQMFDLFQKKRECRIPLALNFNPVYGFCASSGGSIVREMRLRDASTSSTHTFTTSPSFTTSLG